MSSPRVLLFYQHFWPDSPPYATMLRVIGAGLAADGLRVDVLTAQPSYKAGDRGRRQPSSEIVDAVRVRRLRSLPGAARIGAIRLAGRVLFPARALLAVIGSRLRGRAPDVIVAATMPPVINGLCALLAARLCGARFVYHLQDIYPEIGAAAGLWPERSLRHRLLRALDGRVACGADRCVVLSTDMSDTLVERGVERQRIVVINNFMLAAFGPSGDASPPPVRTLSGTRRRVVFAGNLGRFQALEAVLAGFLEYASRSDALELHFLGEGALRDRLVELAGDSDRVRFHGHLEFSAAARFIADSDAGIVSVGERIHRYAYPSKTLTYLGLGVPVLAIVEGASSLAVDVRTHDLGVSTGDRTPDGIGVAFDELERWLETRPNARSRVLEHARERVSGEAAVRQWKQLVENVTDGVDTGGATARSVRSARPAELWRSGGRSTGDES